MLYVLCICFFFFKQKTAYEMRISDWSSGVWSSDLDASDVGHGAVADGVDLVLAVVGPVGGAQPPHRRRRASPARPAQRPPPQHRATLREIGRASCRERVCRYV